MSQLFKIIVSLEGAQYPMPPRSIRSTLEVLDSLTQAAASPDSCWAYATQQAIPPGGVPQLPLTAPSTPGEVRRSWELRTSPPPALLLFNAV